MEIFAPFIIYYEFPRAILRAVRRGRLMETTGRTAIDLFFQLPLPLVGSEPRAATELLASGYDTAISLSCSFYDGVFVSTAESLGIPLITADDRLCRNLSGRAPSLVWLGDVQLP